jgi:hypothetical protein
MSGFSQISMAKMKKWFPYILIGLMAIAIILIKTFTHKKNPAPNPDVTNNHKKDPASVDRNHSFDRRVSYLNYSEHAKCRMNCREISQAEVEEIMQDGKINYNKSDLQNAKCPRYALEGITKDNQRVRIVFAQCNESTVVVTVIDLETEFECHCPGDDDKYKNRN